jgi:glycosyltransferase 2 family protein
MAHRPSARALLTMIGKAAITIAAIVLILSQVDLTFLVQHGRELSAFTLVASLVLLAAETTLIAGLRLKLVLDALGQNRRLEETSQVALSGFFFEQVAFGFVGGDAIRLWLLHKADVPLRRALQVIVTDRFLGSVALLLLALVGLPGLIVLLTGYDWQFVLLAGAGAGSVAATLAIVVIAYLARNARVPFVAEIVRLAVAAIQRPDVRGRLLSAFLLALVAQSMNVFIFFLFGRDLAMGLGLGHWFLIVPPALLISMLPISAGGWGLREASFVVALAGFAIRPEEAIIPPILFGLGVLVVTLPGGIVWLMNRKRASRKAAASAPSIGDASTSDVGADTSAAVPAPLTAEGERTKRYARS